MDEYLIKYGGYILFFLGAIYSIFKIGYEVKKKKEYENLASIREKRFNTYKDFLSKLDLMNSELYNKQFGEESNKKAIEIIEGIKKNPNDLTSYYDYIQFQYQLLTEWMEKYNIYLDELNELRLVGSSEIINLLDEYQYKVKGYLETNAESMLMHSTNLPGSFDISVVSNYVKKQQELNDVRKKIESQMRKDIGNEWHWKTRLW